MTETLNNDVKSWEQEKGVPFLYHEENEDEGFPLLHVKKESDHIVGESIPAEATREICLYVGQACVSKVEVSKSYLMLANHCCCPGIHSRDNFGPFIFK